jgi:hypothetical protein
MSHFKSLLPILGSLAVSGLAVLSAGQASAANFNSTGTIDDFTVTQAAKDPGSISIPTSSVVFDNASDSFIGTSRTLTATRVSGPNSITATVNDVANGGVSNNFNVVSQTGTQGTAALPYLNGSEVFDLTAGGRFTGLAMQIADLGNPFNYDYNITASDSLGNSATLSALSLPVSGNSASVSFDKFAGVDFSKLNNLNFTFNTVAGANFTAVKAIAVPESNPAIPLVLLGGTAVVMTWQKRRQNQATKS